MTLIAAILAALETHFAGYVQAILIGIPGMLVNGIMLIADDEAGILANAVNSLLSQLKSGMPFDQALTATYNDFYNAEMTEGKKIAMAFLESLAKVVNGLTGAGGAGTTLASKTVGNDTVR